MTGGTEIEGLLRELAPQALAVVARRHGPLPDCEDAVQEALMKASKTWPSSGIPDRPLGWLIRVAAREVIGRHRSDSARRRREDLTASWSMDATEPATGRDDSLILLFMCCHEALTPTSAIPLTLRAVGGLTTREIAAAFLVKETTMAQRIHRAKATIRASAEPFRLPTGDAYATRLRTVLHVLYLIYNEGYTASSGPELDRPDLAQEAMRLTRLAHTARPDDPEISALLALMLLTEARRPARTGPLGELVPLRDQDRRQWDRSLIREGLHLISSALHQRRLGAFQIQAAIAALHAEAASHLTTDWSRIVALYDLLERTSRNPLVTVNRAVAVAMAESADDGLQVLDTVAVALHGHHRFHSVRAHLLEDAGRPDEAAAEYDLAIRHVTNQRERTYLHSRAAALRPR